MKPAIHHQLRRLLHSFCVVLILVASASCSKARQKDAVGGREIIELEDGKTYIIKAASHHSPQLELTISKDAYGLAELYTDGSGVPPITLALKNGHRQMSRSRLENGIETIINDEDGDGLPEYRMTIDHSSGSSGKPHIDDITASYEPRKTKKP